MTFQQFLSVLKARWVVACIVLLCTVLTTIIVSFMLPKQYTATASLMVDVKSLDPIQGIAMQSMSVPGYMATQVDILKSERVARKVVSSMGLLNNPQLREDWTAATNGQGSYEIWLARLLARQLEVTPSRDSNVIQVSYTATDPRFAAAGANAFIQAYLAVNLELKIQPAKQYAQLFEEQSRILRADLEAAQAKLSAFQKKQGLTATDERLDVENARLNDLSSQLVALQALAAEASSRSRQAGNNSPEVLNNPVVATLKSDLARQEARFRELNDRLGAAHPQVTELRASIGLLRNELASETNRVASSLGVNSRVNEQRLAQVRQELERQRSRVLLLKEQRDEAAVLLREVENAQRAYDSVRTRLMQTSLESQANQTNVLPLEAATEPTSHSSPKIVINTALSIFLGLGLAVGAALAVELLDRKLRTKDDVTQLFDAPFLGEIPSVVIGVKSSDNTKLLLPARRDSLPALTPPSA